jgi:hypothetical protein
MLVGLILKTNVVSKAETKDIYFTQHAGYWLLVTG